LDIRSQTKNPTPTPIVVRNPTSPKNIRLRNLGNMQWVVSLKQNQWLPLTTSRIFQSLSRRSCFTLGQWGGDWVEPSSYNFVTASVLLSPGAWDCNIYQSYFEHMASVVVCLSRKVNIWMIIFHEKFNSFQVKVIMDLKTLQLASTWSDGSANQNLISYT